MQTLNDILILLMNSLSLIVGDNEVSKRLLFALLSGDLVGSMSLFFIELVGVDNALLLSVSFTRVIPVTSNES